MRRFFSVCTVFVTVLIAVFPGVSQGCASDALKTCINVLIPSLFPFVVCANLLTSLGIAERIARVFSKATSFLFKINGCCAFPIIMGLISGYPMGAITCCNMYSLKKLSKNEASRLLMFSNNSGPVFIISAVGIGLFSDARAGIIIYISHLAAALSVGIFTRFFSAGQSICRYEGEICAKDISGVISESIKSMLTLCGYVIFFSVITGICEKINIIAAISSLLSFTRLSEGDISLLSKGIFEISSALFSSEGVSLQVAAFVISAGGISVLFQTFYFCRKSGLSVKYCILGKLLCAGLSAFYCDIILRFFPLTRSVFSVFSENKISLYIPYLLCFGVICLIFFALIVFSGLLQGGKSACPEKRNSIHTRS